MKDLRYYFPHDYHARHDPKLVRVRRDLGLEGLGLYWCLVEFMYEQGGQLQEDQLHALAYELRLPDDGILLRRLLHDFQLFDLDAHSLLWTSASVTERLALRKNKTERAQEIARKRWGDDERRVKAERTLFYLIRIYNEEEQFLKAGITTESVARRYSGKLKGYDYELLFSHNFDCDKALQLESDIAAKFTRHIPRNKFAGYLECYKIEAKKDILQLATASKTFLDAKKEKEKKRKEKENNNEPTNELRDAEASEGQQKTLSSSKKKNKPKSDQFSPGPADAALLEHPEVAPAWQAFLDYRIRKGWPVSDYALQALLRRLRELRGEDPTGWVELLTVSLTRGWRGIFEPSPVSSTTVKRPPTHDKPTLNDRYADAARRLLDGTR